MLLPQRPWPPHLPCRKECSPSRACAVLAAHPASSTPSGFRPVRGLSRKDQVRTLHGPVWSGHSCPTNRLRGDVLLVVRHPNCFLLGGGLPTRSLADVRKAP